MRFIPKRRTLIKGAAVCLLSSLILGASAYWAIWTFCVARPPELAQIPSIVNEKVVESGDGYRRLGAGYMRRKDGILRMKIQGDPYTRGFMIGRLSEEYIEQQEEEFIANIRTHVPSDVALWLLKVFVTVRNRNLPDFVRVDHQLEIAGYVDANDDPFAYIGPVFHRKLNYHAAHDIGHAIIDNPLVGCTSFAAWDDATADGHLIMGRTFDFDVARSFDTNKLVYFVDPDKGHSFIFVAWPGMIGVVSGINEHKIAVTINAAHSDDSRTIGTPVALVVRDVMQYATTIDDAVKRIRESTMFVNESFLVADGKTGRAVVVEKSPLRCEVRKATGSRIISANHFMTEAFQRDRKHLDYLEQGTSLDRYARMEELLDESAGTLTPESAVAILRDRAIPNRDAPVLGNPASINMLIATHAVVFDVTDGVIWVSASPHQLGAFVPFGFDDFEAPDGKDIIAADVMIENGVYEQYSRSMVLLDEANALLENDDVEAAKGKCDEARELNSDDYRIAFLQTKIAIAQKRWKEAQGFAEETESLYVAYGNERAELEDLHTRIEQALGGD